MATPSDAAGPARSPSLIPTKPPLRLEEGLVEVGWEGDLEAELVPAEGSGKDGDDPMAGAAGTDEELVEDRYAALQAWAEWTRNRERSEETSGTAALPGSPVDPMENPEIPPEAGPATVPASSSAATTASLRSETPHDFAPYSQLFTRLRQSRPG